MKTAIQRTIPTISLGEVIRTLVDPDFKVDFKKIRILELSMLVQGVILLLVVILIDIRLMKKYKGKDKNSKKIIERL